MAHTITLEQYENQSEENLGVCQHCGAWNEGVDPDAEDYVCDECKREAVKGFDTLLMDGLVV